MAKFCDNGHQLEDSWSECPYCVKTGYRAAEAANMGKTRPDTEDKPAANGGFNPGKTVPLPSLRKAPVVGWLVAMNGAQKGEDFRLREGKNSVGSEVGLDVTLRDPAVSAKHASISYKDGKFVITDLDSTNGTFINESNEPAARVELQDNDVIHVGETSLKFKCL